MTLYDRTDFWSHPVSEAENQKPLQVCFKQTFPLSRKVSEDTTIQIPQLSEGQGNKILTDEGL